MLLSIVFVGVFVFTSLFLETKTGPFIITTSKRLNLIADNSETIILIIDLSNSNSAAIAEIVEEYKRWVKLDGLVTATATSKHSKIRVFESLRLSILNGILNISDSITLIKPTFTNN